MRSKIYTAYENENAADAADAVVLVREGFNMWAFVFGLPWLLANRLWFAAACYVGLWIAIGLWAMLLGVHPVTGILLQFFVQLLLGFHARDLERVKLSRRGYHFATIVVADSELAAQQRYYSYAA